jgi:hypothetical protein
MQMARHSNGGSLTDNPMTRLLADSANQAWNAGVDAYERAGSRGGRLFGGLWQIGERLDRGARMRVGNVRGNAVEIWGRLETAFLHRLARSLNALQIPTAQDVQELNRRVEALHKAVVALERRAAELAPAKRRAPSASKSPAARTRARSRKKAGR